VALVKNRKHTHNKIKINVGDSNQLLYDISKCGAYYAMMLYMCLSVCLSVCLSYSCP